MGHSPIYRPLRKLECEIRLLQLQPECDGMISLILDAYTLESRSDYIALSYCWTEEDPTREIFLQGQSFFVRPNLHEYLKVLSFEQESSLVFIDALCINQSDEDEKAQQISLMSEIYRDAREVVAWMGIGDVHDAVVDRRLPKLEALCETDYGMIPFHYFTDAKLRKAFLIAFVSYEYWSRLWILQETILARSLVLRFRKLRLPIYLLEHFLRWMDEATSLDKVGIATTTISLRNEMRSLQAVLHRDESTSRKGFIRYKEEDVATQRESVVETQRKVSRSVARAVLNHRTRLFPQKPEERSVTIADAVELSVAQRCSRPHDTIFGILALTESTLLPSYSMPMILLYIRVLIEGLLELRAGFKRRALLKAQDREFDDSTNVKEFVEALLVKMQLSASHLTTALITSYALGICDSQLSPRFWPSTVSKLPSVSWSSLAASARLKVMPLRLAWCYARNSLMSVEGETEPFTLQDQTATEFPFDRWTAHVLSVCREVSSDMRSVRGMEIGELNESFCITHVKLLA